FYVGDVALHWRVLIPVCGMQRLRRSRFAMKKSVGICVICGKKFSGVCGMQRLRRSRFAMKKSVGICVICGKKFSGVCGVQRLRRRS
ncbi:MAG: hypothetical protein RR061_01960, partial [Muribaculaceae bacterium]